MGKITASDILYIAISRQGQEIASLQVSGLANVTDVMQTLHRQAAGVGLVKFSIRNSSQGWSHTSTVRLV